MGAGVLRNAIKHKFSGHYIQQRHSFSDRITKTPATNNTTTTPSHYNYCQQSKAYYSRFPQFIYRKAKELDFSAPVNIFSTPFCSRNGLVGWYLDMIKARPILTKSITSAVIYTVADFSSQVCLLFVAVYILFLYVFVFIVCRLSNEIEMICASFTCLIKCTLFICLFLLVLSFKLEMY